MNQALRCLFHDAFLPYCMRACPGGIAGKRGVTNGQAYLRLSPDRRDRSRPQRLASHLASLDLAKTGSRYVVPPSKGFGTAIGFAELKRSS